MLSSDTLRSIIKRYDDLETQLASGEHDHRAMIQVAKDHAQMTPLVNTIRDFLACQTECEELSLMLAEANIDEEFRALAYEEKGQLEAKLKELDHKVQILLLPVDQDDARNAILEIRAGTGGEEAALFAGDLMRMYTRYASSCGWNVEVMNIQESDQNGVKDVGLLISGKDVFGRLKFEAGVHRVQRVPKTEASGRIHTSAATVAVLPEVEDLEVAVDENDLRIDVFRSSGPGGQSVNTTDSAVRITHIPTGLVVSQQDEKSQHKNKAKALKVLRSRLYDLKKQEEEQKRSASRQAQVGRGDRSERIRTYNFPQGRLTDHRIGLTLYNLANILEGADLEEVIQALMTYHQAEKMAASHQEI